MQRKLKALATQNSGKKAINKMDLLTALAACRDKQKTSDNQFIINRAFSLAKEEIQGLTVKTIASIVNHQQYAKRILSQAINRIENNNKVLTEKEFLQTCMSLNKPGYDADIFSQTIYKLYKYYEKDPKNPKFNDKARLRGLFFHAYSNMEKDFFKYEKRRKARSTPDLEMDSAREFSSSLSSLDKAEVMAAHKQITKHIGQQNDPVVVSALDIMGSFMISRSFDTVKIELKKAKMSINVFYQTITTYFKQNPDFAELIKSTTFELFQRIDETSISAIGISSDSIATQNFNCAALPEKPVAQKNSTDFKPCFQFSKTKDNKWIAHLITPKGKKSSPPLKTFDAARTYFTNTNNPEPKLKIAGN